MCYGAFFIWMKGIVFSFSICLQRHVPEKNMADPAKGTENNAHQ
jgi:hypothetical protein